MNTDKNIGAAAPSSHSVLRHPSSVLGRRAASASSHPLSVLGGFAAPLSPISHPCPVESSGYSTRVLSPGAKRHSVLRHPSSVLGRNAALSPISDPCPLPCSAGVPPAIVPQSGRRDARPTCQTSIFRREAPSHRHKKMTRLKMCQYVGLTPLPDLLSSGAKRPLPL
jgi:hypothetical protein